MANYKWSKRWDQLDLADTCKKVIAAAKKKPGEGAHITFKGVRIHAKLIEPGAANGDGEVWKFGASVPGEKHIPKWMWEMLIWASPVIFQVTNDEHLECEKVLAGQRALTFKKYTLTYRYDIEEVRNAFDEASKK